MNDTHLFEHVLFQHELRLFETISNIIISEEFERQLSLETITSDLNLAFGQFKVNASVSNNERERDGPAERERENTLYIYVTYTLCNYIISFNIIYMYLASRGKLE